METDRRNNDLREFSRVILLILVAVYLALKIDTGNETVIVKPPEAASPAPVSPEIFAKRVAWMEGRTLFKAHCGSCHNPVADGTGPMLENVRQRWKDTGDYKGKTGEQWLRLWVKNWNEPVKAGHPYAIAVANSRATKMNTFPNLRDEDIDKIWEYVEQSAVYNKPVPMQNAGMR